MILSSVAVAAHVASSTKLPAAGPGHAWASHVGTHHRLDSIATSVELHDRAARAEPLEGFDAGTEWKGHRPARAKFARTEFDKKTNGGGEKIGPAKAPGSRNPAAVS